MLTKRKICKIAKTLIIAEILEGKNTQALESLYKMFDTFMNDKSIRLIGTLQYATNTLPEWRSRWFMTIDRSPTNIHITIKDWFCYKFNCHGEIACFQIGKTLRQFDYKDGYV